jgi:hypothetical protein
LSEETFNIFSGGPEEIGHSVEAMENLSRAHRRLGPIAAKNRGQYFLFSSEDRFILRRVITLFQSKISE